MTAHLPARQPFAALDSPRLQSLANAKNRQNSVPAAFTFSSPSGKQFMSSPSKRRHAPVSAFDDDFDSENVDPNLLDSPTKRSKTRDTTTVKKAPKFVLTDVIKHKPKATPTSSNSTRVSTPAASTLQKPDPQSAPTTSSISTSRGSPKHKRVGLLSKRRTSGSLFTRVDPPSFGRTSRHGSSLPFSIDAALSGTIPSYSPSPKIEKHKPMSRELKVPTLDEVMPKGWFFDIHEDSPEQEATNLMEHSACILDISSDDDCDAKAQNEAREKGKENIPPPDYYLSAAPSASRSTDVLGAQSELVKPSRLRRKFDKDAMDEDRSPLSDLLASDYFGDGLDANSHVIVDGTAPEKPSGLSKECTFEPEVPAENAEDAPAPVNADAETTKATETAETQDNTTKTATADEHKEFAVFDEETNAQILSEAEKEGDVAEV